LTIARSLLRKPATHRPPVLVDPAGHALPINLSNQVAGYVADLHGHQAPHNTTR